MQQVAAEVSTATSSRPVKPGVQSTAPGLALCSSHVVPCLVSAQHLRRPALAHSGAASGGTYGVLAQQHGVQRRSGDPGQAHLRRRGRLAAARLEWSPAGQRRVRPHRRRSGRAGRNVGALGAVRHSGDNVAATRERRQDRRACGPGRGAPGTHRLPPPGGRWTVPAARAGARRRGVGTKNTRHWDELAGVNTLTQLLGTAKPTQREYLGCLAGDVAHDTLWVRELLSADQLRQLQFAVAGNCNQVDRLIGTWHTHPYRAGPDGRALKERGLSAMDLETFAAARDLVTIVMWDVDSVDVATKAPDGSVRHPATVSSR